jgi:hypothetical protein
MRQIQTWVYVNEPPVFVDEEDAPIMSITLTVDENASDSDVSAVVRANDPELGDNPEPVWCRLWILKAVPC